MLFRKCCVYVLVFILLLTNISFLAQAKGIESISALSAVIYEPQTGRTVYEKDAHTSRAMASTTKIMTALIAVENCPLDQVITVTPEAVRVEGSALGLHGGDQITMLDLVTGLLLESGNDAANVVAVTVAGSLPAFAELMNKRAAKIGMKDTVFVTPSGLDEGGHSSSAYDMALLAAEALKNETIAAICATKSTVIRFGNPPRQVTVSNHNRLLDLYPYAVGMKTGFTKKSGRCLVSAAKKDGCLLIAVTLNGGDDWNDHIALYDYGFSKVESVSLPIPELPKIEISGGYESELQLTMESPPNVTLLKGETDKIRVKTQAPGFILAPVTEGETVGKIEYFLDDKIIYSAPLTIPQSLNAKPVACGWQKYWKLFQTVCLELLN